MRSSYNCTLHKTGVRATSAASNAVLSEAGIAVDAGVLSMLESIRTSRVTGAFAGQIRPVPPYVLAHPGDPDAVLPRQSRLGASYPAPE